MYRPSKRGHVVQLKAATAIMFMSTCSPQTCSAPRQEPATRLAHRPLHPFFDSSVPYLRTLHQKSWARKVCCQLVAAPERALDSFPSGLRIQIRCDVEVNSAVTMLLHQDKQLLYYVAKLPPRSPPPPGGGKGSLKAKCTAVAMSARDMPPMSQRSPAAAVRVSGKTRENVSK